MPLRFDHGRHLARGSTCGDCHDGASQSATVADNLLPRGSACDKCHVPSHAHSAPLEADRAGCLACHTVLTASGQTQRPTMPTPRLRFSHSLHHARGIACETCHRDMNRVVVATNAQLPSEATCLECHDGKQATARCSACHPTDASGRLVTSDPADYRGPRLVPRDTSAWGAAHDLSFVQDHAGVAKANPSLCSSCHAEADCIDCHNGDLRPLRIHQADYLTSHALDARARTQDCQACHRMQSDCRACHERLRVVVGRAGKLWRGLTAAFSPPGMGRIPRRACGPRSRCPSAAQHVGLRELPRRAVMHVVPCDVDRSAAGAWGQSSWSGVRRLVPMRGTRSSQPPSLPQVPCARRSDPAVRGVAGRVARRSRLLAGAGVRYDAGRDDHS